MINLNFYIAVSFFVAAVIIALLVPWILPKKQKEKDLNLDPKYIWFCAICTYTYINTKADKISACPRCGSYNKREDTP